MGVGVGVGVRVRVRVRVCWCCASSVAGAREGLELCCAYLCGDMKVTKVLG